MRALGTATPLHQERSSVKGICSAGSVQGRRECGTVRQQTLQMARRPGAVYERVGLSRILLHTCR
jgi:hypothetical protein